MKKINKIIISNKWNTNNDKNKFIENVKGNLLFSDKYLFNYEKFVIEEKSLNQYEIILILDDLKQEKIFCSRLDKKDGRNTFLNQGLNREYLNNLNFAILIIDEEKKIIDDCNLPSYNQLMLMCYLTLNIEIINKIYSTKIKKFINIFEFDEYKTINRQNSWNNPIFLDLNNKNILAKFDGTNENEIALFLKIISFFQYKINIIREKDSIIPKGIFEFINKNKDVLNLTNYFWNKKDNKIISNSPLRNQQIFVYNLNQKYSNKNIIKKCAFCLEKNEKLLDACHIWNVADIQHNQKINNNEKFKYIHDANNGVFLCKNHHKLFDIKQLDPEIFNIIKQLDFTNNFTKIDYLYKNIDENYIYSVFKNTIFYLENK